MLMSLKEFRQETFQEKTNTLFTHSYIVVPNHHQKVDSNINT